MTGHDVPERRGGCTDGARSPRGTGIPGKPVHDDGLSSRSAPARTQNAPRTTTIRTMALYGELCAILKPEDREQAGTLLPATRMRSACAHRGNMTGARDAGFRATGNRLQG